jgi:AraC-like DNA-binding protein
MLGDDHFKLRLVRLQPSELWINPSQNEEEFTFVFLKGGIAKYVFPNATQRLVPGNVLVFGKQSVARLYADEKSECVFATFSLIFEHLFPLFASDEIGLLHSVMANFKAGRIFMPGSSVAAECQPILEIADTQPKLQQRSQLLRIVAAILSDEFKTVHSQRSGLGWFHQHFGLSITALRMEIRLLKAVSLLRNPREKVINVAEQCGFNHLGLFNTCFKRRYGTSPGQWRKLSLGGESASARKTEGKPSCPLHANGLCPWGGQSEISVQPAKGQASKEVVELAGSSRGQSHKESRISSVAGIKHGASRMQPESPL